MDSTQAIHHYCTYPGKGGAGIAAARLVEALRKLGKCAEYWGLGPGHLSEHFRRIEEKRNPLANIRRRIRARQINSMAEGYLGTSPKGIPFFSDMSPHGIALADSFRGAGLLHFHWVCNMLDYENTFSRYPPNVPLIWTLHDMYPFTGGCVHSLGCDGYMDTCSNCPQLNETGEKRTKPSLLRKIAGVQKISDKLTVVCPSIWLADKAKESTVFRDVRVEVIRNGLDLDVFCPDKRARSRSAMGFNQSDVVLLFVAVSVEDQVKGMQILKETLPKLSESFSTVKICYVGRQQDGGWPETWQWLGEISEEEKLASIYAASDVLVLPSIAENYPNVIAEAFACGVPVVASDVGGIPEMVVDGETGALFAPGDKDGLRRQLSELLRHLKEERDGWSRRCREVAINNVDVNQVAKQYIKLYEEAKASL